MTATTITVEALINAPVEKVWNLWTGTDHIIKWNCPSPEWHTPKADHELKPGGKFNYRMEARDGSMGFDFLGVFDKVEKNKLLTTTLGDGRKVEINFTSQGENTLVVQNFEAETENTLELQKTGWQGILDSFKKYVEIN